jgi:hypothetical protein
MGCVPCQQARQRVVAQASAGNLLGTVQAMTLGAKMMVEKMSGVDLQAKYGVPLQNKSEAQKPYVRE